MKKLLNRFLSYISIDTQSDESSTTCPSTLKQLDLVRLLECELLEMGLNQVEVCEKGYLMATLPSNVSKKIPIIGFVAHVDTSPDVPAEGVNPLIIKNYDGGDIILNKDRNIILSPKEFPELQNYRGHTIITTDGTTLLGADDKAGVAEIISAIEYLTEHPEIKHGEINVCFTPDEEISRGVDHFDIKKFNCDFAYTIDGGEIGVIEYENFNAAIANVTINGRNIHPGVAKDKMINSVLLAMEINSLLPPKERPEHTESYEGFFHLIDFSGKVEITKLRYLIRDHDKDLFESRKTLLKDIASELNTKYGINVIKLNIKDQYYNMKEKISSHMHIIELAKRAMISVGVTPIIRPIRGGTDGARLSYMGLPTPNIFTGGHNYHGRYEYIPLESMIKATQTIVKIAELNYSDSNG